MAKVDSTFFLTLTLLLVDDEEIWDVLTTDDELDSSHLSQGIVDITKVLKLRLHLQDCIVALPIEEWRL